MSNRSQRNLRKQLSRQRKQILHTRAAPPPLTEALGGGLTHINHSVTTSYQGPIPPPNMLREYNELVPGAADRILQLAEDQSRHRMDLEKYVTGSNGKRAWCGLAAGLVVVIAALICGTALVFNGYPVPGGTFGGVAIASLAGVFVYGTRSGRQERIEKAKIMAGQR